MKNIITQFALNLKQIIYIPLFSAEQPLLHWSFFRKFHIAHCYRRTSALDRSSTFAPVPGHRIYCKSLRIAQRTTNHSGLKQLIVAHSSRPHKNTSPHTSECHITTQYVFQATSTSHIETDAAYRKRTKDEQGGYMEKSIEPNRWDQTIKLSFPRSGSHISFTKCWCARVYCICETNYTHLSNLIHICKHLIAHETDINEKQKAVYDLKKRMGTRGVRCLNTHLSPLCRQTGCVARGRNKCV